MALTECRECGSRVSEKAKACPECGVSKPGRRWWKPEVGGCGGCLVLIVLLGVLIAVLGDSGGDSPGSIATSSSSGSSGSQTNRCESVPASMVAVLEDALTVQGGGSIPDAAAVRSGSFERIYFIAAEIEGPGLEGAGDIGVWASNRLEGGAGLIFSVDQVAQEFSQFGPGGRTDANITMADDGAREAVDCLGQ